MPSISRKAVPACMLALASSLMLTACGGGDDEDDDDPPAPPPPPAATFSVTATVSGLTSNGLVLRNNGAGSITVPSGATTATIATGVASGSAYAVTVGTQPSGQTCTVTNGSGTVTANVSNVAINCVTPPPAAFTVGGTITGLTGTGLSLRLNNNDDAAYNVSPAGGASTFAFAQLLSTGQTYQVSIRSLPSNPAQVCTITGATGTIGTSNVSNVAIACTDAVPFTVGGTVTGLTGTGLSLQLGYGGAAAPENLAVAANGAFTFTSQINSPNAFGVSIGAQPTGQTCTVTRGRGASTVNITDVAVVCNDNPPSALRGTYTFLLPTPEERLYINFNADGTLTAAMILNDSDCGAPRNGNGVEYGVFSWNPTTKAFTPVRSAVDTNGSCGIFDESDFADSFRGTLTRSGDTLAVADSEGLLFNAVAVESNPGTLVGGWVTDGASNGVLLVIHADGTFMFAETQSRLPGASSGQERGCYTISGAQITFNIEAACKPDGLAAKDLNGPYGIFGNGMTTTPALPFVINDANSMSIGGVGYRRTVPN